MKARARSSTSRARKAGGVGRGRTGRRPAEAAPRSSAARLRLALDAARVGTFDWDLRRKRVTWSRWAEQLWGFRLREFDGSYQAVAARIHPDDRRGVEAEVARCLAAREPFEREFRVVWPDASEHWIDGRGEFTHDRVGRAVRVLGVVKEVTERKRIEAALQSRERDLAAAQRIARIGSWTFSPTGPSTWSDEMYRIFGVDPATPPPDTESFLTLIHSDDRPAMRAWLAACLAGDAPGDLVFRISRPDGTIRTINGRGELIAGARGAPARLAGTAQDVTESARAEEALRESAARLAFVISGTATGLWDWNLATDVVHYSHEWKRMLGYEDDEIGDSLDEWRRLTHPDDVAPTLTSAGAFLTHPSGAFEAEFRMRHKSGDYRWIQTRATTMVGDDGLPARLLGLHLDVTERKQAGELLRRSGEKFSALFHAASLPATVSRLSDHVIVDVNDAFTRQFGYTKDEAIGKTLLELGVIRSVERRAQAASVVGRLGAVRESEMTLFRKSGDARTCLMTARVLPIPGEDHSLTYVQDITDRRRMEDALRRSHEQLRAFVDQAPLSIALFDREMRYIACSRRWIEEYGRGATELVGRSHYGLYPDLPERWKVVHRRAFAGEAGRADEDLWVQPDGTNRWLRWAVIPWRDEGGDVAGLIIFAEEVTEIRRARTELRNLTSRLMDAQDASRRELARELHDRVGQNLTALNLSLTLAQGAGRGAAVEPMRARLEDCLALVAETTTLVRNVMAELRPPALDDLGLGGALRWHGDVVTRRSGVQVWVAGDACHVRLSPRAESALFRIAEEAITNVTRHARAREIVVTIAAAEGGVRLTVTDDGEGFDPASLGARATWGLASMRERAAAIDARFRIESAPGQGTTVVVDLPEAG